MGIVDHIRAFRADLGRYRQGATGPIEVLEAQGVWATAVYRYGQWVYASRRGVVGVPLKIGYRVMHKAIEVTTGISVPASVRAGDGLYIGHFGQIIVHPDVKAGRNLSIGQGVTIGARGGGRGGVPVIGDDVYIGVGAKVLGAIHIGDGVRIGANAVVIDDVPSNTTVVGIPARPVRSKEGAP